MIKYFSLSRAVRQYRIILVLCTLYCLVYNNWSDNKPSDTSGKQLNGERTHLTWVELIINSASYNNNGVMSGFIHRRKRRPTP